MRAGPTTERVLCARSIAVICTRARMVSPLQIDRFNNRLCFDEVIDDNRLDACRRTVDVLHAGDSERDQSSNSQFHVVSLHHIDDYDREARRRRQLQSAWGLLQNSVLLATSCGLASG